MTHDYKRNDTFATMVAERAQALVVLVDPLTVRYREQIVELAMENRLPAMYGFCEFVDAGGLIAYGVMFLMSVAAPPPMSTRSLRDSRPADLPVEQPTRFELLINLKTAKALGLEIPPIASRPRRRGDRMSAPGKAGAIQPVEDRPK